MNRLLGVLVLVLVLTIALVGLWMGYKTSTRFLGAFDLLTDLVAVIMILFLCSVGYGVGYSMADQAAEITSRKIWEQENLYSNHVVYRALENLDERVRTVERNRNCDPDLRTK